MQRHGNIIMVDLNVLYEIGLIHGLIDHRFGLELETEPLIILKEEKAQLPSDLQGFEFLEFKSGNITALQHRISTTIIAIYNQVKNFMKTDCRNSFP